MKWVWAALIIFVCAIFILADVGRGIECDRRGGTLVRTATGHVCAKVEELK